MLSSQVLAGIPIHLHALACAHTHIHTQTHTQNTYTHKHTYTGLLPRNSVLLNMAFKNTYHTCHSRGRCVHVDKWRFLPVMLVLDSGWWHRVCLYFSWLYCCDVPYIFFFLPVFWKFSDLPPENNWWIERHIPLRGLKTPPEDGVTNPMAPLSRDMPSPCAHANLCHAGVLAKCVLVLLWFIFTTQMFVPGVPRGLLGCSWWGFSVVPCMSVQDLELQKHFSSWPNYEKDSSAPCSGLLWKWEKLFCLIKSII
jgi:hypothetical protein